MHYCTFLFCTAVYCRLIVLQLLTGLLFIMLCPHMPRYVVMRPTYQTVLRCVVLYCSVLLCTAG
jgi:hypothetical protein